MPGYDDLPGTGVPPPADAQPLPPVPKAPATAFHARGALTENSTRRVYSWGMRLSRRSKRSAMQSAPRELGEQAGLLPQHAVIENSQFRMQRAGVGVGRGTEEDQRA